VGFLNVARGVKLDIIQKDREVGMYKNLIYLIKLLKERIKYKKLYRAALEAEKDHVLKADSESWEVTVGEGTCF
jgi:hypothetical protein